MGTVLSGLIRRLLQTKLPGRTVGGGRAFNRDEWLRKGLNKINVCNSHMYEILK